MGRITMQASVWRTLKLWSVGINSYTYALVAGTFIGIGFPFGSLWPAVLVGIALLSFIVSKAQKAKGSFLLGYTTGGVASLYIFAPFFLSTLPSISSVSGSGSVTIATIFLWLFLAVCAGLPLGVYAYFLRLLQTRTWFDIVLLPSIWILCELFGSVILYAYGLGAGSLGILHHTINYIGYLAANDSVLLRLAPWGGVYLLSFVIVATATLGYRYFESTHTVAKKQYQRCLIGVFAVFLFFHVLFGVISTTHQIDTSTDGVHAGLVSMYTSAHIGTTTSDIDTATSLLEHFSDLRLLVLPYGVDYLSLMSHGGTEATDMYRSLMVIGRGGVTPIVIDSNDTSIDNARYAQITVFKGQNDITHMQEEYFFPFIKYSPVLLGRLFAQQVQDENALESSDYASGIEYMYPSKALFNIGIRQAEEVESPLLYRTQTAAGAELLVELFALQDFHGSPMVYEYMKHMAQMRAAETGRFLVASGLDAPALALDQHGEVLSESEMNKNGSLKVYIHNEKQKTFYVQYGMLPSICFALFCILLGLLHFWKKSKASNLVA